MLKIISSNVRGLRDTVKRRQFYLYLKDKDIDIAFVQETHCTVKDQNIWQNQWGSNILFSNGNSNARGVMILFKRNLDYQVLNCIKDDEGRFLIGLIEHNGQNILLLNNYAPNNDQPSFFSDLLEKISNLTYDYLIWGGDFNKVLDSSLDCVSTRRQQDI